MDVKLFGIADGPVVGDLAVICPGGNKKREQKNDGHLPVDYLF